MILTTSIVSCYVYRSLIVVEQFASVCVCMLYLRVVCVSRLANPYPEDRKFPSLLGCPIGSWWHFYDIMYFPWKLRGTPCEFEVDDDTITCVIRIDPRARMNVRMR